MNAITAGILGKDFSRNRIFDINIIEEKPDYYTKCKVNSLSKYNYTAEPDNDAKPVYSEQIKDSNNVIEY